MASVDGGESRWPTEAELADLDAVLSRWMTAERWRFMDWLLRSYPFGPNPPDRVVPSVWAVPLAGFALTRIIKPGIETGTEEDEIFGYILQVLAETITSSLHELHRVTSAPPWPPPAPPSTRS